MKNVIFTLVLLVAFVHPNVNAETVVVVSAKATVGNLDKDQVSDIFLGKSPTFPNGEESIAVDFKESSALREQFHTHITGKKPAQLKAYWSKMLFSGKGTPPKEVASVDEMKQLIANNPSLIGYMDGQDVDASVKVVLTF
jgi:ABC-type phosphate transport system substrate-binding protein